jgi:hypothetical protein
MSETYKNKTKKSSYFIQKQETFTGIYENISQKRYKMYQK